MRINFLESTPEVPFEPLVQTKPTHPRNPFKVPDAEEFASLRRSHLLRSPPKRLLVSTSSSRSLRQSVPSAPIEPIIPVSNSATIHPTLSDYIHQKRELFLSELAIDAAREELQRLERIEGDNMAALKAKQADIDLVSDQFREFLVGDGKVTMESRKGAEAKARKRVEVVAKIKEVSAEVAVLRSEIAHHNERMQECREYRNFLEALTPKDWAQSHPPSDLYFKKPQQLLDIMSAMEEQNMFLILHCQEAEEQLERCRAQFNATLNARDGSIMGMLEDKRQKVESLAKSKERNERYLTHGEFRHGNELGDAELIELQTAIAQFHRQLGFDAASVNDTATMLSRIEKTMHDLSESLALVEPVTLRQQALTLESARRDQERTERQIREKKEQEEKTQKALQLAMMPIKARVGRPILERILPKIGDSREKIEEAQRQREAQEAADEDLLGGEIWD
jgi:hypothetical protein